MKKTSQNQKNQRIYDVYNTWGFSRATISKEIYDQIIKENVLFLESFWVFDCNRDIDKEAFVFTKYLFISFLQNLKRKRIIKNFKCQETAFDNYSFFEYYISFDKYKFLEWYKDEFPEKEKINYNGDFFGSKELIQRDFLKSGKANRPEKGELKVLANAIDNENKPILYRQIVQWYGVDLNDLEIKNKGINRRATEIISRVRKKLKPNFSFKPIGGKGWIFTR